MARYIIERNVGKVSRSDVEAVSRKSAQVLKEMTQEKVDITWVRSWVSEAEGKIYCEYDAPNPEVIREHAKRTGVPADRISLVMMQLDPAMFM